MNTNNSETLAVDATICIPDLLMWVTKYSYEENDAGIGKCEAYIYVRDEAEKMKRTYESLDFAEKKHIMCALIEKVGFPCEDYDEDFDDPNNPFFFTSNWTEYGIHFYAEFRV